MDFERHRYPTKDSGKRQEYDSGMVRDTQEGKPRYDLLDRTFLRRCAQLMARGADKYGENNWRNANSEDELRRFEASAARHLYQWLDGDLDEDHAAAVNFNLAAAEYVRDKLGGGPTGETTGHVDPVPGEETPPKIHHLAVDNHPKYDDSRGGSCVICDRDEHLGHKRLHP